MKARIDWMESGRVKISEPSYSKTSRNAGKYINSSGGMSSGSIEGQHVTEYAVYEAGKTYTFTYWRPSSSSQLCVAFIDSGGNVLSGSVYGGTSGAVTASHTTPAGTVIVRVYGIYRSGSSTYTAEASMIPVLAEGVCAVSEIRLKPIGATTSQPVWPTTSIFKIVASSVVVRYSDNGSSIFASGYNFAYATADIQEIRGETVVQTLHDQILTPVGFDYNPQDEIAGQWLPRWRIENVTLNGTTIQGVKGNDQKSVSVPNGYGVTTTFRYATDTVTALVSQQANVVVQTTIINRTLKGFSITPDIDSLASSGGNVVVTGRATFEQTPHYRWSSGSYSDGPVETSTDLQAPSNIAVSPSTGVVVGALGTTTTITFPANGQNDEIDYTITGTYYGSSGTAHVGVKGSDTGRVYSDLAIQSYSYGMIPAKGGSVYPTIQIRIYCSVNGGPSRLLQGSVSAGETSCNVSGSGITATVPITYIGAANGLVSALSRGTNVDSGNTVVASGLQVRVSKSNLSPVTSSSLTVYQQQNQVTFERQGTFHVTAFSVAPKSNNAILPKTSGSYQLNTAASTIVSLDVRASGSGTTTYREYTSEAHSGGNTVSMTNEEVIPTALSVKVGNTPVTVTGTQFTAANGHVLTDKNYTIKASYEDSGDVTETLHQVADEKISSGAPTYYASIGVAPNAVNSIWAGGGEVILRATAYHITGTKWKSDNAPVPGESTQTWDTARLTLGSTLSGFTVEVADTQEQYKDFRLVHRDMEKSVTTDTASLYAKNGPDADSSANPVTFSVSNSHGETYTVEDQAITWGSVQTRDVEYSASAGLRSLDGTDPMVFTENNPGLFTGDTAVYLASASHVHQQYQTGSRKRYTYQKYTSWSAEHDDDNHRDFISAEDIDPQTRLVSSESVSDSYSVSSDAAWIVVNTTAGTVTLSPQPEEGRVRRGYLIVTNTNDPAATQVSAQRQIVQNAWASLTASPISYQIGWRGTDSAIISVDVKYTKFSVELVGGWYGASIKLAGQPDSSYVPISPTAEYGNTGGLTQYTLKFSALSPNDPEHNPDGYSMERISNIRLNPVQDGVSSIYLHITQEEYHGGLPNN